MPDNDEQQDDKGHHYQPEDLLALRLHQKIVGDLPLFQPLSGRFEWAHPDRVIVVRSRNRQRGVTAIRRACLM